MVTHFRRLTSLFSWPAWVATANIAGRVLAQRALFRGTRHNGEVPNPFQPPPLGDGHLPKPKRPREDRTSRRARLIKEMEALPIEQRDKLKRINRLVMYCMGSSLGAMLAISMPLPWAVLGMAMVVVTVVIAIRGLVMAVKVPLAQGSIVFFAMGLAMSALFALYSFAIVLTWQQQLDYQRCLQQTQTVQGQDQCTTQFKDSTQSVLSNLLRTGR